MNIRARIVEQDLILVKNATVKSNRKGQLSMYKCEKCEEVFKEPTYVRDVHTECSEQPYEIYGACPYCGCMRIEEIEVCKLCGEPSDKMVGDYCCDCVAKVTKRFGTMLHTNFEVNEIDLLNAVYEGREL